MTASTLVWRVWRVARRALLELACFAQAVALASKLAQHHGPIETAWFFMLTWVGARSIARPRDGALATITVELVGGPRDGEELTCDDAPPTLRLSAPVESDHFGGEHPGDERPAELTYRLRTKHKGRAKYDFQP